MPLLDVFNFLIGKGTSINEAWAESPETFEDHFNVPFQEFELKLNLLDRAHMNLYEKTLEVNPEAAVTWVFWIAPD